MRTMIMLAALLILVAPALADDKEEFTPVDLMPQQISMAQPVYPEKAKKEGIFATVIVKAYIDSTGTVSEAEAIDCDQTGYGFEEVAVEAARQCKFRPAERQGQPVGVWVTYKIIFQLDDEKSKG